MAQKIDDDTLQRYYDGDLSPLEASSVRAELAAAPEARARLDQLAKLSELMKLSAEELSRDLDGDALFASIRSGIDRDQTTGGERLRVIASEWVEHRRASLVSAAAIAAVAAAALFVVMKPAQPTEDELARSVPSPREERRTAIAANVHGTRIENVDFGDSTGTVFEIQDEGVATAVVWISDEEEMP
jgi:anti-sigma factor RsiW